MPVRKSNSTRGSKSVVLAVAFVLVCGLAASAASYVRTTLKELTHRAGAVVEVEVLAQNFPPLKPGDTFPRTNTDLKVLRALKGDLGKQFVLDTPGGINGDTVSFVPDGPEFKLGEHAFVFVKEPEAGHYMVQDLGLGKFNIVERNGEKLVENPICPKAIGVGAQRETRKDVESELITKSIPYATFCDLIQAYAAGNDPSVDPETLALRLPNAVHVANAVPPIAATASALREAQELHRRTLWFALFVTLIALTAGYIVYRRRQMKAQPVSTRSIALILGAALACGAGLGGSASHAFVTFAQMTKWDLDKPLNGKVAGAHIIWKQSVAVSKTNPNVFTNVQTSFDTWQAVASARLAFTAGGMTQTTAASSTDTENIVAWTSTPSSDFSASTLAITFSSFTGPTTPPTPSTFLDADIIFNDRDFSWAPGQTGNPSSVSLHEIGHFVGFQHTTDPTTVMFPFDGGLIALSPDEIAGAQALYPSGTVNSATPPPTTPPTAVIGGSPTSGAPGTTVSFSSAGSAPAASGSPIVSFAWDYGDGSTDTGATVSHMFTDIGTYNVSLTVTDAAGLFGTAMLTISIGDNATSGKASFKLNFAKDGADSFSAQLTSSKLVGFKDPKGSGKSINGTINIGDQPWLFTIDTSTGKSTNKDGPKIALNDKSGTLVVQIKSADLRDVLGGHGADNDNLTGVTINVPVEIWFQSKNVYVFATIPFSYSAKQDKSGSGKH